jgi:hypothetical protein
MAPRVPSPMHGRAIRTVKQCPPFVDAMTHGFMVLLPCDVACEDGSFRWHWPEAVPALKDHPRAPLSFHVAEQLAGSPLAELAGDGRAAIKFNSFWTIELEPGWSLMVSHPANRLDLPFLTLTGLVDADLFHDVGINFPALWTDRAFRGVLARGTPVAQCHLVRREGLELDVEPMSKDDRGCYEDLANRIMTSPGVYRKGYRRRGST